MNDDSEFSTNESTHHHFGRKRSRRRETHDVFTAVSGTEWGRLLPLWSRCGAKVFGPSLDDQLADGEGPDANAFLTARALYLSSWQLRRSIANSWLDLLIQARERVTPFDPRIRPIRRRVFDAEYQIRALADALVAPLTTIKGVAMASSLLGDGAGPLYNPGNVDDLQSALRDVVRELNPLAQA
jgi:hypothetical protein